jgi:DNA polymerase-3 subunit gamma/tau
LILKKVTEIISKLARIVREEKIKVGAGVLEAIARHANGHMRDAESLLGQVIALGSKENSPKGKEITLDEAELVIPRSYISEAIDMLQYLSTKDAGGAVSFVNRLTDNGADLKVYAGEVVDLARRMLLAKISPELGSVLAQELGDSIQAQLEPMSARLETDFLSATIERFISASRDIKDAPFPQLPLELAIIDLCFGRLFSTDSVVAPIIQRQAPPISRPRPAMPNSTIAKANPKEANTEPLATNVNPEGVKNAWQELLVRVKQHNHSLSFVLKSCQFMGLDGSTLRLAFKHKFHHDRLNEPAIRQLVEGLLQEITGNRIAIATTLDPNLVLVDNNSNVITNETAPSANRVAGAAVAAAEIDSSVIDNLLKNFGGKVVS